MDRRICIEKLIELKEGQEALIGQYRGRAGLTAKYRSAVIISIKEKVEALDMAIELLDQAEFLRGTG